LTFAYVLCTGYRLLPCRSGCRQARLAGCRVLCRRSRRRSRPHWCGHLRVQPVPRPGHTGAVHAGVPIDTPEVAAAKTAHLAAHAKALALQGRKKRSAPAYADPAAVATYAAPAVVAASVAVAAPSFGYSTVSAHAAPVAVAAPDPVAVVEPVRSFGYSTVSAHADPVVVAAPAPAPVAVAHAAPAAVPAVAVAHAADAAPYAVAAPAVSDSSQYQAQDTLGQYSYGYADSNSQKQEVRTANGITHGGYSYVDGHGLVQSVKYHADALGFRVAATNLPVGPAAP
ncbi:hypothetical protein ANN_26258, partial [Periplaneta americana]